MKNDQELVFFDLETTGLDQTVDQIIEIGAVKVRGGKEIGRFEQFCRLNDGSHLPEFISALTGITPLDLEPAEPVEQVIREFMRFAGGSPLLAHNSAFDSGFLRRALHGHLSNVVYDTLQLARVFFPNLQSHSLVALVDALEIRKEEAHRALGDSLSLFRFYRRLKDKITQAVLPQAVVQRLLYLFPMAGDLGLLDSGGMNVPPEHQGMEPLSGILSSLDTSRLPRLKALKPGLTSESAALELQLLSSGRDVLLQCPPSTLQSRYLSDIQALNHPSVILLRSPAAVDPLLEDAAPTDGSQPLWISEESPNNLVCLMLLDRASQSPTMRAAFGFEMAALLVYEWETRSVFIPEMPLFLRKSELMDHVSAEHCQLEPDCPFACVCPIRESLHRARAARIHITDLAQASHVFTELGDSPVLVSSPETEKLLSEVLEVPELQISSVALRIMAGMAGEHMGSPSMARVADLASQASGLLTSIFQQAANEENPGARGRVPVSGDIRSEANFTALREIADAMVNVLQNTQEDLRPTVKAAYLSQARTLSALVDNADNPDIATWTECHGSAIILAGTRTILTSRVRACSAGAQFFLAGTSVCPAGDQRFMTETFGLGTADPPVVIAETQDQHLRVPTFVTLYLPRPSESGFEKSGSRLIAEVMRRFPGRAAVASNSLETLRRMQSFLAREPGLSEYALLLPRNGHARTELMEQYTSQEKAILLIPFDYLSFGDILPARFLFVTKLQFPNSFLPTVARFKQTVKERRGDAFRQFDLPYALTLLQYTLHQIDPQTLRTVFMLDNRSFSSAYADRVRNVLPTSPLFLPMESQENLLQHLDRWMRNQTL